MRYGSKEKVKGITREALNKAILKFIYDGGTVTKVTGDYALRTNRYISRPTDLWVNKNGIQIKSKFVAD